MYKNYFKHVIDFVLAMLGFMFFLPFFLLLMIGLTLSNFGSPFFLQKRPGKNEKIFTIIKFKTMNDKRDGENILLKDSERLTSLGKIVRKMSLDEVPQLLNVIKGDMSLIGPRPLLPEYLPFYSEFQKKRHNVRPGITGLAQVKGRNHMVFSERIENDVFYVENLSLLWDLKIIILTVKSVLFKSSDIILGQTVDNVDDIGLSKNLNSNHFKTKKNEY